MTDQLTLTLDSPGRVHRDDPATSRHAAETIAIKAGKLKHRLLQELARRGDDGANDWELHVSCDPRGRVHSAATRRGELEALGLVERTSRTRPTDTPGNQGTVHRITQDGLRALERVNRG